MIGRFAKLAVGWLLIGFVSNPDSARAESGHNSPAISRQDSLLLAGSNRLDPSRIKWQSVIAPSWGAWQSEHQFLAVTQALVDVLAVKLLFTKQAPDAGAGLLPVIAGAILAINRVVGVPFNIYLAHRYNSDRLDDPMGPPPFHDDRYHLGINGRLGIGGIPFGAGLTVQHRALRLQLQTSLMLESYPRYPVGQPADIAELRPSFALVGDYRIKLGKAMRLRPGIEAKVSRMRVTQYGGQPLQPTSWVADLIPRVGLEVLGYSRFGVEASIGYAAWRSPALNDFQEASRLLVQGAATLWLW